MTVEESRAAIEAAILAHWRMYGELPEMMLRTSGGAIVERAVGFYPQPYDVVIAHAR